MVRPKSVTLLDNIRDGLTDDADPMIVKGSYYTDRTDGVGTREICRATKWYRRTMVIAMIRMPTLNPVLL